MYLAIVGGMPADTGIAWSVILGCLLLIVHAARRFDDPPGGRATTTLGRYVLGTATYFVVLFVLYAILLSDRTVADAVAQHPQLKSFGLPIGAAMLLSVSMSTLPGLATVDDWLRRRARRLALIPDRLDDLVDELSAAPIRPSDGSREALTRLRVNGAQHPAADELLERWQRVLTIGDRLAIQTDRRVARSIRRHDADLEKLAERRDTLSGNVDLALRLVAASPCKLDVHRQAGERFFLATLSEVRALHRDHCRFVARTALISLWRDRARAQWLDDVGFDGVTKRGFGVAQALGLLLLMGTPMTLYMVLIPETNDLRAALRVGIMASLCNWAAVLAAVEPRLRRWRLFTPGSGASPMSALLASTGLALVASLALRVLLSPWGPAAAVTSAPLWLPWVLLDGAIAFVTALNAETRPPLGSRLLEAFSQGAVLVAAALAVYELSDGESRLGQIDLTRLLPMMFVYGSLVGGFVPELYRRELRRRADASARAGQPIPPLTPRRDDFAA